MYCDIRYGKLYWMRVYCHQAFLDMAHPCVGTPHRPDATLRWIYAGRHDCGGHSGMETGRQAAGWRGQGRNLRRRMSGTAGDNEFFTRSYFFSRSASWKISVLKAYFSSSDIDSLRLRTYVCSLRISVNGCFVCARFLYS